MYPSKTSTPQYRRPYRRLPPQELATMDRFATMIAELPAPSRELFLSCLLGKISGVTATANSAVPSSSNPSSTTANPNLPLSPISMDANSEGYDSMIKEHNHDDGSASPKSNYADSPFSPMANVIRRLNFDSPITPSSTKEATPTEATPTSVCQTPAKSTIPNSPITKTINYLQLCSTCVDLNATLLPGIAMVECGYCNNRYLYQSTLGGGGAGLGSAAEARPMELLVKDQEASLSGLSSSTEVSIDSSDPKGIGGIGEVEEKKEEEEVGESPIPLTPENDSASASSASSDDDGKLELLIDIVPTTTTEAAAQVPDSQTPEVLTDSHTPEVSTASHTPELTDSQTLTQSSSSFESLYSSATTVVSKRTLIKYSSTPNLVNTHHHDSLLFFPTIPLTPKPRPQPLPPPPRRRISKNIMIVVKLFEVTNHEFRQLAQNHDHPSIALDHAHKPLVTSVSGPFQFDSSATF